MPNCPPSRSHEGLPCGVTVTHTFLLGFGQHSLGALGLRKHRHPDEDELAGAGAVQAVAELPAALQRAAGWSCGASGWSFHRLHPSELAVLQGLASAPEIIDSLLVEQLTIP